MKKKICKSGMINEIDMADARKEKSKLFAH